MGEYNIVPEFRYYKTFPFLVVVYQLIAIGFVVLGTLVAPAGFVLAFIFQFCAFYYASLFFCNRNYCLKITPNVITVSNILNKSKKYQPDKLNWKIQRIPWYNSYFILLYASGRHPIAIVKPHWKNALRILRFPHRGGLSTVEREYLIFLKHVGLL